MSRVRGVFPLFLATTFGIVNGIWVFGPAFKEQQKEREEQALKAKEVTVVLKEAELKTLRDAEAVASRKVATNTTLRADDQSSSWWPSMSIWSRGTEAVTDKPATGTNPAQILEDTTPNEGK